MPKEKRAVAAVLRAWFHDRLRTPVAGKFLYCYVNKEGKSGIFATNADMHNPVSVGLSDRVATKLKVKKAPQSPITGQRAGSDFERQVKRFLEGMLRHLTGKNGIRPGNFDVQQVSRADRFALAKYEQYAHLKIVQQYKEENPELAAALGSDYLVSSDVIVERTSPSDADIDAGSVATRLNKSGQEVLRRVVDENTARRTRLRSKNISDAPLLHATVSCKWTLRSDRSQNVRVESQNVSRNRKGNQPHIVVVTAECLPSRLVSVALSTGDIDSVYHFALDELIESMSELAEPKEAAYKAALEEWEKVTAERASPATIQRNTEIKSLKREIRKMQVIADDAAAWQEDAAKLSKLQEDELVRIVAFRSAEKALATRKRELAPISYEKKQLTMLVDGKRLKDISDLPFDLMV